MKKIILNIILLSFIIGLPYIANAQPVGLVPCGNIGEPPCQLCHIFILFNNIISFLLVPGNPFGGFPVVLAIAGLMILWSGFLYIMSFGDPKNLIKSREILKATGLGLLIVYGAWAAVNTLSWFGIIPNNWFTINCPIIP
ncbi:MAG: hypothetical protein US98_C0018G0002 [Parcubacteria group bacterium GW2011_GWC1_38_6]|nr:MAG: hypothetical protein UR98_C0002G0031 [Parcubacteria group bacterium GW2011_GWA1_36_12]KKQ76955.1 MAG: hypothetical protein US98_C0018G0002 [Parcubacteria group bacterium GW2011_GWC1_38_6]